MTLKARIAALEHDPRVLTFIKLGNVALAMLWGFAVTFIFVRLLPGADFQLFLMMMAFNNLVSSTEFGLSNIIYSRLRHFWLGDGNIEGLDFRREEIGALFAALTLLVLVSTLIVAGVFVFHASPPAYPVALVLFFLSAALSLQVLVIKRGLAAIDRNLLWEGIDLARRLISLAALVAMLGGLAPIASALVQLAITILAIMWGMAILHRQLGMQMRDWFALRCGGGHMRRSYLRNMGASVAFTLCEIIAYNAPYFAIGLLGANARLMLIFDFLFKMSRAVSFAIRATVEAALPRLTRRRFEGDRHSFVLGLAKAGGVAVGVAGCAGVLLLAIGGRVFDALFDGKASLSMAETVLIVLVLLALALVCLSVYVQAAMDRYGELLRQSFPFVLGALALVPLTLALAPAGDEPAQGVSFLALNAVLFAGLALLHIVSLVRLVRSVGASA